MCSIKLDMCKAYDQVEWSFLKEIMLKLGFRREWVNLIMQCVTTVEYRVRINAEENESFKPTRGLRQGDPLSPYLFLLCTEGLNALLSHAEENGNISGVKVCRDAPPATNLLFADDSLILMKANQHNVENLKSALWDLWEELRGGTGWMLLRAGGLIRHLFMSSTFHDQPLVLTTQQGSRYHPRLTGSIAQAQKGSTLAQGHTT